MATVSDITEADSLDQLVLPREGDLSPHAARSILNLRFNESATKRLRRLLTKNNAGKLSAGERLLLDKYLRVGQFLDLMQAKARLSTKPAAPRL
jgi:hypothetical protein